MENIIFSGDLYIKYYPTRVCELSFDSEDSYRDEISNMDLGEEEIAAAISNFMLNFDQIIREENPKSTTTSYDYSKNSGFYFFGVDPEGYRLTSEKHIISGLCVDNEGKIFEQQMNDYCIFETMDELKEHFVSLSDFLVNAKNVGFVLEPIKSGLDRLLVLCEYKDTYLVINGNGEYDVISKHHPDISNYMCGKDIPGTFDKKEIYLEIFKQKFNKGNAR